MMTKFNPRLCYALILLVTPSIAPEVAVAQSSASTYSYGTYNPVQAAINRDSMNAAILRQARAGHKGAAGHSRARATAHRHR